MAPRHQGNPWCDEREGRATSCASSGTWSIRRTVGGHTQAQAAVGLPSLAEEASQLAGGRDLGVWRWCEAGQAGVTDLGAKGPGG